ncbi:hypothetical protein Tco_0156754 [Tanacetum coccineum]
MHDHQMATGCAVYTRKVGSSSDNDDAGSTGGTQWIICRGLLKIKWFTNTGDANREWRRTNRSCSLVGSLVARLPTVIVSSGRDIRSTVRVYPRITSLKCVLTQEHLDAICAKYFVPKEVHPQLPSSDATMHERPADEFVVPANARFGWFLGTNIVKDRAPAPYEYNVEDVNTLIAQASLFLRFPEEFLCWIGISRNYLLNKDTYPRFEYEKGEDPRKVRIVERARAENERPIVTVAKHHTVTLLPTSMVSSFGELSASMEREFVGDASVGDGGDQGFDSVGGQDNVEPIVPITDHVETETPGPKRTKKKRVTRGSEKTPAASHLPKRLRADYGTTSGFATGATLWRRAKNQTNSRDWFLLCELICSLPRSIVPVMTEATAMTTIATIVVIPADVGKDKSVAKYSFPHPPVFCSSSSSERRILLLVYLLEWSGETMTKGFELNDGRSCANMIDHFTPPAFFKTVRGMEHEQLFVEFNVSAARNLSLSSETKEEPEIECLISTSVLYPQSKRVFHSHLLNPAGWRWLLAHGMKLLMAKCLNSTEYMEALRNAFGRTIRKECRRAWQLGLSTDRLADV